ncbi:MAG: transposase [Tannerellaceae bacterium]|nr:transposase [Tannerellaceae bacterium]
MGSYIGISFIDSTALKICHIKREHQNRVFDGIATKGRSTLGWF